MERKLFGVMQHEGNAMLGITAVILTYNESIHLERCIQSLNSIAEKIVVVDSFSTDNTVDIARRLGAQVLQNPWVNHGVQFNWALDQLNIKDEWILRIDADEYLSKNLIEEIKIKLPLANPDVEGFFVNRKILFQGKKLNFGGLGGTKVMRIFRHGKGRSETRLQDEHIIIHGKSGYLQGSLVDQNLQSISWWISKHNRYASNEAMELLKLKYQKDDQEKMINSVQFSQVAFKRWLKENIYVRVPLGIRAFIYFIFRYIFLLGFLDGIQGFTFHFLQGFWYRYLVDLKIAEVERCLRIRNELNMDNMKLAEKILRVT
jgi:glycosyltransferase involved in cell wall biosynthesis